MENTEALKQRIKAMLVENLMLQIRAEDIKDDQQLFGPGSLGLDSVDALQLVVALDKNFGLKIETPAAARGILQSVDTIVAAVREHMNARA
jgi:acyl carrier protein